MTNKQDKEMTREQATEEAIRLTNETRYFHQALRIDGDWFNDSFWHVIKCGTEQLTDEQMTYVNTRRRY